MLTPAEAEKVILDSVAPFHREDCPIGQAHGRVLRVGVKADRDLPPFDRVTLDGYAIRSEALAAGQRVFRVEGLQAAGMRAFTLSASATASVEVMTGSVLPHGADTVIPYEETVREGDSVTITLPEVVPGHGVHRRGEDRRQGEEILAAGVRLSGREIAVAASCGYPTLTVSQQPRIAVVSTGDELVEIDRPVAAHQVRRSNDHAARAALLAAGYPLVTRLHLRDVPSEIGPRLAALIAEHDVVVLMGGVSKGKFDLIPAELERHGVPKRFHGVLQRPGKPMWFGVGTRGTLVFALPGNPVSCYTCLHRYVLPALAKASGVRPELRRLALLGEPFEFRPHLTCFLPVKIAMGPNAETVAKPCATNTSGDFSGLIGTDGFLELPAGTSEFPAGTLAPFWPWV